MSSTTSSREVQVDEATRKKPKVVARLAEWEYLERSLHRILCGWGRHVAEWEDKVVLFRQIWECAECVRRLRERLVQFPGTTGNLEAPVSKRLENLANAVLLAPSLDDALDGALRIFNGALAGSYIGYANSAHPVHDAPTLSAINENVRVKESFRLWLQEFRRRKPHQTEPAYERAIRKALANCDGLAGPLPVDEPARAVGVGTRFRLPSRAAHPKGSEPKYDLMPYLEADFSTSIETRRLFWCYGYMLEMNLAEDQLRWIWDAPDCPWDLVQDMTRHMWDESRHGDSGRSRLLDFGITLEEIGYPHYEREAPVEPNAEPMTAKDLYEAVFFIGMVAETGHFTVKHEAYEDFKAGGDMESAEMVLFDIIDETSHVQYAHKWLPFLAQRAGLEEDFKKRGAEARDRLLIECRDRSNQNLSLPKSGVTFEKYQELLGRMRARVPLSNAESCSPRSYKPM